MTLTTNKEVFGTAIQSEFQLDSKLIHFNNGSFGTVPHSVRRSRIEWLDKIESHPDLIAGEQRVQSIEKSLSKVAQFVNANLEDIVFIKNATEGINIILNSLNLTKDDTILYFNTSYAAVISQAEYFNQVKGVNLIQIQHKPGTDKDLINSIYEAIEKIESQNKKITIAIVDAISSVPGLILPYEQITKILQQHGAKVAIDGAHAFGQLPLNLNDSKADYFVSNLHKWGYAYRPTAILYAKKSVQDNLRFTVVNFKWNKESFKQRFEWPGTIDYSPWLAAEQSIEFINKYGQQNILNYIHDITWYGGNYVAKKLNTTVLGDESQNGNMINIKLPLELDDQQDYGALLSTFIWKQYNFRIKCFYYENQWWVRLCGQLFLTKKNFEDLGDIFEVAIEQFKQDLKVSQL